MAIKTYKPYTPSRRSMSTLSSADISAKPSVRKLLIKLPYTPGATTKAVSLAATKRAGLNGFIASLILNAINLALRAKLLVLR